MLFDTEKPPAQFSSRCSSKKHYHEDVIGDTFVEKCRDVACSLVLEHAAKDHCAMIAGILQRPGRDRSGALEASGSW